MDKRAIIAISVAIGVVAGGFSGYGVFLALNPERPASRSFTLTIVNYKETVATNNLTWAPSNVGSNYTDNLMKNCVTIIFEENTNVTLVAGSAAIFTAWTLGPDAVDVHWVSNKLAWIVMDSNKVIEVSWEH